MGILSEKTIKVLEAIKKIGPTYQREIAKETEMSDTTVNAILKKLEKNNMIKSTPDNDEKTGRLIRKIELNINPKQLEKIIKNFKTAKNELDDALIALRRPGKK